MSLEMLLGSTTVERLGWTLLHFAWQGGLLALVFAELIYRLRSPRARYHAAVTGLSLMLVAPIVTYGWFMPSAKPSSTPTSAGQSFLGGAPTVGEFAVTGTPGDIVAVSSVAGPAAPTPLEGLVGVYLLGLIVGLVRFAVEVRQVRFWGRRGLRPVPPAILTSFEMLRRRLGVSAGVGLFQSTLVAVPSVVGWLRPRVLLPVQAVTGLTLAQLEGILAHELAHVARLDPVVNLLQRLAETLLFYHPAVWWLSRRVREERELCCDDMALDLCPDRFVYAQALMRLELFRSSTAPLQLASQGGSLLGRIRRLTEVPPRRSRGVGSPAWTLTMLLLTSVVLGVGAHRVSGEIWGQEPLSEITTPEPPSSAESMPEEVCPPQLGTAEPTSAREPESRIEDPTVIPGEASALESPPELPSIPVAPPEEPSELPGEKAPEGEPEAAAPPMTFLVVAVPESGDRVWFAGAFALSVGDLCRLERDGRVIGSLRVIGTRRDHCEATVLKLDGGLRPQPGDQVVSSGRLEDPTLPTLPMDAAPEVGRPRIVHYDRDKLILLAVAGRKTHRVGDRLTVFRKDRFVGLVQVFRIDESLLVARVLHLAEGLEPRPGDGITGRLNDPTRIEPAPSEVSPEPGGKTRSEPVGPPPVREGAVLAVREDANLVILSIGQQDGVSEGQHFELIRGDTFVGEIEIIRVTDDLAGGRLINVLSGHSIRVGDRASIVSPRQEAPGALTVLVAPRGGRLVLVSGGSHGKRLSVGDALEIPASGVQLKVIRVTGGVIAAEVVGGDPKKVTVGARVRKGSTVL